MIDRQSLDIISYTKSKLRWVSCRPSQPAITARETPAAVEGLSLEQKAQEGNISKAQAKRLRKKIREGRTEL